MGFIFQIQTGDKECLFLPHVIPNEGRKEFEKHPWRDDIKQGMVFKEYIILPQNLKQNRGINWCSVAFAQR